MAAYAVAHMRQVSMGPQIVEYLYRIDATLELSAAASWSMAAIWR